MARQLVIDYLLNQFDLTGRVAVVTGAGGGLGRNMAKALASAGAQVIMLGRSTASLEEAAQSAGPFDVQPIVQRCDVRDSGSIERAVEAITQRHKRIDILVNAAGIIAMGLSVDLPEEKWDEVIDTNLKGAFLVSRIVAAKMIDQGRGKIINVGSITSERGLPGRAAYAASKGGVLMLTRTLAGEWAPFRVNVNAINPGFFRTRLNDHLFDDPEWRRNLLQQIPMGQAGDPADLEGATLFLASNASDYVTGQVIYVDGGYLTSETNLNLPSSASR